MEFGAIAALIWRHTKRLRKHEVWLCGILTSKHVVKAKLVLLKGDLLSAVTGVRDDGTTVLHYSLSNPP